MKVLIFLMLFSLYFILIEGYKLFEQRCKNVCVHKECSENNKFCTVYYQTSTVESNDNTIGFNSGCYMVPIDMKIRNPNDFYNCSW